MIYIKFSEGSLRRRLAAVGAVACALGFVGASTVVSATGSTAAQGSAAAGRPALWRTYDMIINLQNLPRTYTCDQLWYEFRGILVRLGAWPYSISILPYHCSPTPTADMKSPDVQVHFQLPFFLQGVAAKSAPVRAIERTIRLAPGEPKTLQTSDCQLLQQIDGTLFANILAHVDAASFHCSADPRRAADFDVTLSLPVAVRMPSLKATTSGPDPH